MNEYLTMTNTPFVSQYHNIYPYSTEQLLYNDNNPDVDELTYEHDIKIQQLEQRLNILENLVNRIMQNKPPYWDE